MNKPSLRIYGDSEFSSISAQSLLSFYRHLIEGEGVEDFWSQKSLWLIHLVIDCLVYFRDHHDVELSFASIDQALLFENMEALTKDHRLPERITSGVTGFIDSLPAAERINHYGYLSSVLRHLNNKLYQVNSWLLTDSVRAKRCEETAEFLVRHVEDSRYLSTPELLNAISWLDDPIGFIFSHGGVRLRREVLAQNLNL